MFFLFQNKTVLTFNHGKHTARFNVGSKLKVGVYETHFVNLQFLRLVTLIYYARPFATLEARKKLEPECVLQVFLGLLLGTRRSAVGMVTGSNPSDSPISLGESQLGPVPFRF